MERDNKEQLGARDPRRAWETIEEMILSDEGMTVEELDEELRKYSVDPDESVRRLYLLALEVLREASPGGRVSPHVSEVLSQLGQKCFRSEPKAAVACATGADNAHSPESGSGEAAAVREPKARAAGVLSYHRNYKEETANDRAIRLENERRLQEKVEKLRQSKQNKKR